VRSTNNENPVERKLWELFYMFFQHYGFIVKFLENISREQGVLFFLGIRFWRTLSVLSCFPSRWGIISLTQKSIF
jgi:hypothetical protein